MRVAAGAIARKYLAERLGVRIHGYLSQIGALRARAGRSPTSAYDNPFFCPDPARIAELEELIWKIREAGDSIGARVTVIATGVPPGPRRARVRPARCGHRPRDDGHQRGEGRRDRRGHARGRAEAAASIATSSRPRASRATTPAASSAASPPGRTSSCTSRFKPTPASRCRAAPSTWRASPSRSSPPAATIPAWACAPRRSPKRCSRIVLMDHYLRHRAQNADVTSATPDHHRQRSP